MELLIKDILKDDTRLEQIREFVYTSRKQAYRALVLYNNDYYHLMVYKIQLKPIDIHFIFLFFFNGLIILLNLLIRFKYKTAKHIDYLASLYNKNIWELKDFLLKQNKQELSSKWDAFIFELIQFIEEKEHTIHRQEKSIELSESAQRISHNISNFLNPMDFLLNQLEKDNPLVVNEIQNIIDKIRQQIHFLKKLNIMIFDFENFSIIHIIKEAISQLKYIGCKVKTEYQMDESYQVPMDPQLLSDAMINLIKNAMEAAVESGNSEIVILVNFEIIYIEILITNPIHPDKTLNIDELNKAFFSTKKDGMGIGFLLSKRIIEAHSGDCQIFQKEHIVYMRIKLAKQLSKKN